MGAPGESVRRLTELRLQPRLVARRHGDRGGHARGLPTRAPGGRTASSGGWTWRTGTRRLVTKGDAVQPSWSPTRPADRLLGSAARAARSGLSGRYRRDGRRAGGGDGRRRLSQLEPGLVARRRIPLLRQRPRRQHEPLAGPDRRGSGRALGRAAAASPRPPSGADCRACRGTAGGSSTPRTRAGPTWRASPSTPGELTSPARAAARYPGLARRPLVRRLSGRPLDRLPAPPLPRRTST